MCSPGPPTLLPAVRYIIIYNLLLLCTACVFSAYHAVKRSEFAASLSENYLSCEQIHTAHRLFAETFSVEAHELNISVVRFRPNFLHQSVYLMQFPNLNQIEDPIIFIPSRNGCSVDGSSEASFLDTSADGFSVTNDENGNGNLDPGETADLNVILSNSGGADGENIN